MKNGMVFLGMGFEMVGIAVGGFYAGKYIDQYMGWEGKASGYLVIVLMIGWFIHFFYLIQKMQKDIEDDDQGSPKS